MNKQKQFENDLTDGSETQTFDGAKSTDSDARVPSSRSGAIDDSDIAALAYELWQQRGCPDGCPEEDWLRAERELSSRQGNGTPSRSSE